MIKRVGIELVMALTFAMGLAVSPAVVMAAIPTEISVYPGSQNLFWCAIAGHLEDRAYWTVSLWGGTSGSFHWSVSYGDGHSSGPKTAPGPNAEFDRHHDYDCGHSRRTQHWNASRGGGGSDTQTTAVETGI